LDADPQRVEFQAEDGKNLVGYYYPSMYANAPVIILMHWAGGDLTDWCEIAPWLQNRQSDNPAKPERCANATEEKKPTWLDPTWFPPMSPQISMAVFAFDFRGYGESEAGGGWSEYAKDARAAFETAAGLEGVDPTRMAAIGASIGADGAADGCLLYNQSAGSGCLGALSLSPGNYLDMPYAGVVTDLAPNPVWCLAAEGDGESAPTCKGASGDQYRSQIYAGSAHGMMLITPDLEPQPMLLIREFLMLVFAEAMR
jgi:pimeloyl-ACP methyl ester carboxylesterase